MKWIPVFAFALAVCSFAAQPDADTGQIDLLLEEPFDGVVPEGLELRARIVSIEPAEASAIKWRHGGEGLSGSPVSGTFPKVAAAGKPAEPNLDDLLDSPKGKAKKPAPAPAAAADLEIGEWSAWLPVAEMVSRKAPERLFLTVTAGRRSQYVGPHPSGGRIFEGFSTNLEIEFETRFQGKTLKTFRSKAEHGSTVGAVIRFDRLAGGKGPTAPEFIAGMGSLLDYAKERETFVRSLPLAGAPMPTKYQMLTALNGYGEGAYHGIRYSEREVAETEGRTLRMMGINGFQGGPSFLHDQRAKGEGLGLEFARGGETNIPGYPTPRFEEGRADVPEAGCPYAPGVPARQREAVQGALDIALNSKVDVFWGITEDEIGTVVDRSPEGKAHYSTCPHCKAGFHEFLKSEGLSPADFGESDWNAIAPLNVWDAGRREEWLGSQKGRMLGFWTRRFNCHASARLFTPLRDAFNQGNAAAAPGQPRINGGAMRGNTFLMKGHSLDFFNFYRLADNQFVYETSNRDARVWQWDSYLCDVGRKVSTGMDKAFGVLVKPHRGAPVQRGLSAVGRGATMINWYTYGPEYAKGDSFSQDPDLLALVQKANAMIAASEDVLFGSEWVHRPEIAIIKPLASEIWMGLTGDAPAWTAAWENAKWMHTALTHAHLPVDAIDQVMVRENDLSQYKVIYVNGPNLESAAVAKLAEWVKAGGTLVTCGWGLSRDEYNEPLDDFLPMLGLESRAEPEMWRAVPLYGATALGDFTHDKFWLADAPDSASVRWEGTDLAHRIHVGREVLQPTDAAEVLARWGDGSAAITRTPSGAGAAVVIGFFPGLEYAASVLGEDFDMTRFDPTVRHFASFPAADRVEPVVAVDVPTVEGLFVRNRETRKRALILMNWTYRAPKQHTPMNDVHVRVRTEDPPRKLVIALGGEPAETSAAAGGFEFVLPRLEEGEVLLLDP